MNVWVKIAKKNEKSTRRRETTRARSRPVLAGSGGASKVKHVQQSAHREVNLISIWGVYGSKPGLNLTSRSLRRQDQQI